MKNKRCDRAVLINKPVEWDHLDVKVGDQADIDYRYDATHAWVDFINRDLVSGMINKKFLTNFMLVSQLTALERTLWGVKPSKAKKAPVRYNYSPQIVPRKQKKPKNAR